MWSTIDLPSDILARLQTRDEAAYRDVLRLAGRGMLEVAMIYLRSEDLAEDVVQDVLYRIYLQGENFQPSGSVIGYLLAAVRNAALSVVRHTRVEQNYEEHVVNEESDAHRGIVWPDESLSVDERSIALEAELTRLTDHQRAALKLRYEHGLSIAEVGEALGISARGAEKLLSRTAKLLRDRLLDR